MLGPNQIYSLAPTAPLGGRIELNNLKITDGPRLSGPAARTYPNSQNDRAEIGPHGFRWRGGANAE